MTARWRLARRIAGGIGALLLVLFVLVFHFAAVREPPPTEDCPLLSRFVPLPRTPVSTNDFLELRSWPGYSSWNPYTVRVYGDGRIERETTAFIDWRQNTAGCPLPEADRHGRIPSGEAASLIARARDGGFCRMCGVYRAKDIVRDAGSAKLTLSLGGNIRSVFDSAGDPPPLFHDLAHEVEILTSIQRFADRSTFSAKREAECNAFGEEQYRLFQERRARKTPGGLP